MGRLWYVSEVQPPAFADGLCVEYEHKGRVMSDGKMFCPSSWKGGFAIDRDGKDTEGLVWTGRVRNLSQMCQM